jgi:hypothetical protein
MRYHLPFAIAPRQLESVTSRRTDHISSQKSALGAFCGCVGKHPTTRITDNLLSAVRACSNSGIENVPSVCASETVQDGPPSAVPH